MMVKVLTFPASETGDLESPRQLEQKGEMHLRMLFGQHLGLFSAVLLGPCPED